MREESSSTIFSPIGTLLGPVPWRDAFTDSPESTSCLTHILAALEHPTPVPNLILCVNSHWFRRARGDSVLDQELKRAWVRSSPSVSSDSTASAAVVTWSGSVFRSAGE